MTCQGGLSSLYPGWAELTQLKWCYSPAYYTTSEHTLSLKQFQAKIIRYVWGKGGHRLSKVVLFWSREEGVLGIPNLFLVLSSCSISPDFGSLFSLGITWLDTYRAPGGPTSHPWLSPMVSQKDETLNIVPDTLPLLYPLEQPERTQSIDLPHRTAKAPISKTGFPTRAKHQSLSVVAWQRAL